MHICGSYDFSPAVAVTSYQQTGVWLNEGFVCSEPLLTHQRITEGQKNSEPTVIPGNMLENSFSGLE